MAQLELYRYLRREQKKYFDCIQACVACWLACEMCSDACLDEKDVKMMVPCIRLDHDCAALCKLAAESMVRGGPGVKEICRSCAELCEACGRECGKHEAEHCQLCAEACQWCAVECRKLFD